MRFVLLLSGLGCLLFFTHCSPKLGGKNRGLKIVWADEFSGSEPVNRDKWNFDIGGNGWGNNELQHYTDRTVNARQLNGKLVIEAHKEDYEGNTYTSARLVTRDKQTWGPGHRIAIRAKLPSGRGTWPAIWMLGENIETAGWPLCGEIDIMEHVGYKPDTIFGTVHTKAYNHLTGTQKMGTISANDLETNFHVYSIDWTERRIDFKLDGVTYHSFERSAEATIEEWPFDEPQYLLLNVAVGGWWGSRQGIDETIWPQRMEVDWVRVWEL